MNLGIYGNGTPPNYQTRVAPPFWANYKMILTTTSAEVVPQNVWQILALVWGGGGGGSTSLGGSGGGFCMGIIDVVPGQTLPTLTVGAAGSVGGGAGGTSSFGTLLSSTGGAVGAVGGTGTATGVRSPFTATGGTSVSKYGGGASGSPYGNGGSGGGAPAPLATAAPRAVVVSWEIARRQRPAAAPGRATTQPPVTAAAHTVARQRRSMVASLREQPSTSATLSFADYLSPVVASVQQPSRPVLAVPDQAAAAATSAAVRAESAAGVAAAFPPPTPLARADGVEAVATTPGVVLAVPAVSLAAAAAGILPWARSAARA